MIPDLAHWVKGSGIATAVAQVSAVARIQPLAQELPNATGEAIKKKKKERKEKKKEIKRKSPSSLLWHVFNP